MYGTVSSITRVRRSRNQRVAILTITSTDPLAKVLLPVPVTSFSPGLEDFVAKGGMILMDEQGCYLDTGLLIPVIHRQRKQPHPNN
jgi:hypothetical protein